MSALCPDIAIEDLAPDGSEKVQKDGLLYISSDLGLEV